METWREIIKNANCYVDGKIITLMYHYDDPNDDYQAVDYCVSRPEEAISSWEFFCKEDGHELDMLTWVERVYNPWDAEFYGNDYAED